MKKMNVQQRTYAVVKRIEESSNRPVSKVEKKSSLAVQRSLSVDISRSIQPAEIREDRKVDQQPDKGEIDRQARSLKIEIEHAVKGQERCIAADMNISNLSFGGSIELH